jgi:hypothetical protein
MENRPAASHKKSNTSNALVANAPKLGSKVKSYLKDYSKTRALISKDLLVKNESLPGFCKSLLKRANFKNFKVIYLFVHEKGNKYADLSEFTLKDSKNTILPVSEFNDLFQAIKKVVIDLMVKAP